MAEENEKEVGLPGDWDDSPVTATKQVGLAFWRMRFLVVITVFAGALSVLIMWGINGWEPLKDSPVSSSLWESFFAVFGLTYAIIVGLFLVESCRRRNELSSIIYSEVNAIGDIHDCLGYFIKRGKNKKVIDDIIEKLRNYVQSIKQDWNIMRDPRSQAGTGEDGKKKSKNRLKMFNYKGVRPIIEHVSELDVKGEGERHALEIISDRVCDITTYRVNRRELAQHGLTQGLYLLIPFMSVVIWVATLLLPVGNDWVHGFIVFSTTVALIALFLLLVDADHPFIGLFSIKKEVLDDLGKKLARSPDADWGDNAVESGGEGTDKAKWWRRQLIKILGFLGCKSD